jgi:hypothetical protein
MIKKLLMVFISIVPLGCIAQRSLWSTDTASQRILHDDCHGLVFEHTDQTASLNTPMTDFEDTLQSYLQAKGAVRAGNKIRFKFIVTTRSQIFDITKEAGKIKKEEIVREALQNFSSVWNPAVQNGRNVCSYVQVDLVVQDKRLHIAITP